MHEKLKALRTAHGHALHELFAVQQQALARMQQTYSARLATLRSLYLRWRSSSGRQAGDLLSWL